MSLKQKTVSITEKEYLLGEESSVIKHEFYQGQIYAMSGASKIMREFLGILIEKLAIF